MRVGRRAGVITKKGLLSDSSFLFLKENCLKYAKVRQKEVFVNQGLLYKTWHGYVNYFLDESIVSIFFKIQVRVFTSKLNVPKTEPAGLNAAQRNHRM